MVFVPHPARLDGRHARIQDGILDQSTIGSILQGADMGTTYTSTININVWKEHTCVRCGRVFRYLFQRKKTGQGATPDKASAAAKAAVVKALAHETDLHPCPGCGLFQPDMIGARKATRHGWMVPVVLLCVSVPLILYAADVLNGSTTAFLTAGPGAAVVFAQWLIDRSNLNRDLESNRHLALMQVEKGELWVPENRQTASEVDEDVTGAGWTSGHSTAYVMMLLGLVAFLSPEAVRTLRGWKANPEWVPLVVGPGDEAYVYFPDKITSVKGYWNAKPTVAVSNWRDLGLKGPQLKATSKTDSWGAQISVGSKESKTSTNALWLRLNVPPDAQLAGKTLDLDLALDVNYPELAMGDKFAPRTSHARMRKSLALSGAGAGAEYRSWWWGGFLGGAFLLVVPSIALVRLSGNLRRRALPTNIFVPDTDQAREGESVGKDEEPRGSEEAQPPEGGTLERDDRIRE
jgi:hypothetical protein